MKVSAAATPTRSRAREPLEVEARENRWAPDLAEYKTLRKQGYQPPRIDGCHERAVRATTREQIETP